MNLRFGHLGLFVLCIIVSFELVFTSVFVFYDPKVDPIEILDNSTFDDSVYEGQRASIVEFYAHWCGRCQRFTPTFRAIAKGTKLWHNKILRIAAVDCATESNLKLCRAHHIEFYPTFHMFEANAPKGIMGVEAPYFHTREQFFEDLIDFIEKQPDKPTHWPSLAIYGNKFSDIFKRTPNIRYALLIFEEDSSFLARKIILDFNEYADRFIIKCVTMKGNAKIARKLQVDADELPTAYLIENQKEGQPTSQPFHEAVNALNKDEIINTINIDPESVLFDDETDDPRYELVKQIKTFLTYSTLTLDADEIEL